MNTKEDYNEEPVSFCNTCLSLHIIQVKHNVTMCKECGNHTITTSSIENWQRLYEQKKATNTKILSKRDYILSNGK